MPKKYFYLWLFIGILLTAAILSYILKTGVLRNTSRPSAKASMQAVGTFYPLAHFAEQVGGNYVNVINITPAGIEPHDYEPTSQDIIKIYNAKVFIMNGGGVDAWAEKIKPKLQAKGLLTVDIHSGIEFMKAQASAESSLDPHIWLDPLLAEQAVRLIQKAFIKADPPHADIYNKNAMIYIAQLQNLDNQYKTGLAACQLKDIVTSHSAFGYLAKRYNFNQIPIAGLSPDAEPTAQQLVQIAGLAKNRHIKYIFFETLVSPKLAQTIANTAGAEIITLNPLEGLTEAEIKSGKTYLTEMKNNLRNLRTALRCK